MALWECCEQLDDTMHASLRYDDVASSGSASRPLEFPTPKVFRCQKVELRARDHRSGTIHNLQNVIIRSELDEFGRRANVAYLLKKKLCKSIYGSVRLGLCLKRIGSSTISYENQSPESRQNQFSDCSGEDNHDNTVQWESTDMQVAIKASSWVKINSLRGKHLEDPIKEVAAMQHLGNYEPSILGARESLQDDDYLYTVMNYLPGGDLYGRINGEGVGAPSSSPSSVTSYLHPMGLSESQAREWFLQLLKALFHLQKKGVCHRDISLENLLLDEKDRLVLIDPGMSMRVPYIDPCNYGGVMDASAGTCRRLIKAQGLGGKLMYAAPEVIQKDDAYDGFAIDLWSAGVVLFVMLVGLAPFKWAHPSDQRYNAISQGELGKTIASLDIPLSKEACHLLQGMFHSDPRKRFSLAEVMEHPWVLGQTTPAIVAEETAQAAASPKRRSLRKRLQNVRTKVPQPACEKRETLFRSTRSQARTVDSRC